MAVPRPLLYVFRVAITSSRIVGLDENGVVFRHKHRAANRWRTTQLSGHEFMRRFLQHVLPKGLHKVRYYGLRREHAAQGAKIKTPARGYSIRCSPVTDANKDCSCLIALASAPSLSKPIRSATVRGHQPACARASRGGVKRKAA